uniref:Enoyl-coa hydratase n=2 Tax=Lutzomyia longipalpis TaxID=7200 RepID=A0A1B0CEY3_LUTLO
KDAEAGGIEVTRQGEIGLIGINRPSVQNSLNDDLTMRLFAEIERLEEDNSILVGVLHGVGGTFCAGYDLNSISRTTFSKASRPTRRILRKPFVCAMSGYCLGNGLELALMCDMRVIEESCVIGFLNRRFGVPLIDGGTARLPAMVGLSRALDLILTGRHVTAKEAFEMGLASRFVANGTGVGQAVNAAIAIAKFPQKSLMHDRASVYRATFDSPSLEDSMRYEIDSVSSEIIDEAVMCSRRFSDGLGKGGKFHDIKKKPIADWEADEIAREKTKRGVECE